MKTNNFYVKSIVLIVLAFASFYSCEKEEVTSFEEETVVLEENEEAIISERSSSATTALHTVRRYYAGAPYTSYSYRLDNVNIGASFGANQGPRFKLNTIDTKLPLPSGTKQLYVLHHKAKRDFMFTTNRTERNNIMATGGWYDRSIGYKYTFALPKPIRTSQRVYIHTRGGNGRTKLYRFYDNSGQSIHLFTTNYQEGASKGYKFEGVVGYVRL